MAGGLLGLLALILLLASMYTVDERERVIVVRFGQVLRADDKPGIHFKMPFGVFGYDSVITFNARILTLDFEPQEFLTKEKKYVVVDSFVKWRIADPLKYYLTVGGVEGAARQRLEPIINSGLRDEFGKRDVHQVIATDRGQIMCILRDKASKSAGEFGIEVVDMRIQRVDWPSEISQSVYQRMKAERLRIANELRAKGVETATKIQAEAEREREIALATAYRQGEITRGEGDARATSIYAGAANQAPEFYSLYRSLGAYKESFKKKDDVLIVDPSSDFFRYMKKSTR
jgi:membrane protease subunit HflC